MPHMSQSGTAVARNNERMEVIKTPGRAALWDPLVMKASGAGRTSLEASPSYATVVAGNSGERSAAGASTGTTAGTSAGTNASLGLGPGSPVDPDGDECPDSSYAGVPEAGVLLTSTTLTTAAASSAPTTTVGFDPSTVNVILYHGNCLDGALAATLLKAAAGPECRVHPCWWEEGCTDGLRGLRVACVDITPPEPMLWRLVAVAGALFVVDHHVSSLPVLQHCLRPRQFLFDTRECGASLVWKWLASWRAVSGAPPCAMPPLLPYVRALDLFSWRDPALATVPDAMAVSRALDAALEPTIASMEAALAQGDKFLSHLRVCLPLLNRCIDMQIARACASCAFMRLAWQPSVRVAMVNTQTFVNFVGHRLYTCMAKPVEVVWLWYCHGPSGRVRVSLRSWGTNFDCAAFAQLFHGGGHFNSAAFTCTLDVMRSCLVQDMPDRAPGG